MIFLSRELGKKWQIDTGTVIFATGLGFRMPQSWCQCIASVSKHNYVSMFNKNSIGCITQMIYLFAMVIKSIKEPFAIVTGCIVNTAQFQFTMVTETKPEWVALKPEQTNYIHAKLYGGFFAALYLN